MHQGPILLGGLGGGCRHEGQALPLVQAAVEEVWLHGGTWVPEVLKQMARYGSLCHVCGFGPPGCHLPALGGTLLLAVGGWLAAAAPAGGRSAMCLVLGCGCCHLPHPCWWVYPPCALACRMRRQLTSRSEGGPGSCLSVCLGLIRCDLAHAKNTSSHANYCPTSKGVFAASLACIHPRHHLPSHPSHPIT